MLLFLVYTTFFDDTSEIPDDESADTASAGEATEAPDAEASA